MPKSEYLANRLLQHGMGKSSYTMPTTVYAVMMTVAPAKTSTGSTITEPTYTGYARVAVPSASLSVASGGVMTSTADIEWPDVTAGSSTIVAVGFVDAATGGNLLYYDADVGNVNVSTTQTPPVIRAGSLTLSED